MNLNLRSAPSGAEFVGSAQHDTILWDVATRKWTVGQVEADGVAYDPFTPVNWGPTPPETVAGALDQLANVLSAGEEHASGALGPGTTATFTTPAITPKRGGLFLIVATLAATGSAAASESCNLLVNGVSVASANVGTGNGSEFQVTLIALATIALGQVVAISATASTGTNTVASGGAKIALVEFGG